MGCGASTQERWEATVLERKMSEGTTGDRCPEPCPRAVRRRLNRMILKAKIKELFNQFDDVPPEASHTEELGPVTAGRICDWVKKLPRKQSMVSVVTYSGMSPKSGSTLGDEDEYYDDTEELVPADDLMTASGSLYAPRRLNDARQISRLQFLLRQKELAGNKSPSATPNPPSQPSPSPSPKARIPRNTSSNIFPQARARSVTSSVSSSFRRRPSISSANGFEPTRIHCATIQPAVLKTTTSYGELDEPIAHLSDV
eukprot:TRINITY_DN13142_c0_g1_i1.p1 TRINITY_DN13142_c0_g1~~TRINITY_DN13142_c0_g1_i1.p1  ORF type:complete len:256 (+),score=36.96 TRINITY_DN13142_c0_g1_i1:63-830(+)